MSDESFLKLREMKQLRMISILDTAISAETVKQLQKELPETFIQTNWNKRLPREGLYERPVPE